MDLDGAAGNTCDAGICLHWRRDRNAAVELAAAAAVWLAPDYLLAGARAAASLPNSVWRMGRVQRRERTHAPSPKRAHGRTNGRTHARTLGKDDPGGTREIPAGTSRLMGHCAASGIEDKCLIVLTFSPVLTIERWQGRNPPHQKNQSSPCKFQTPRHAWDAY